MDVFKLNTFVVTANYTIPSNKGVHSVGPIKINESVKVIISTGSKWIIL